MSTSSDRRYPGPILRTASDYGWRILIVGAVVYALVQVLSTLSTVVIPFLVAMLITALLHPVQDRLRRWGLPRPAATLVTLLVAIGLLAGTLTLVIDKAISEAPQLGDQVNRLIPHLKTWLETGPLKLSTKQVDNFSNNLTNEITKNTSAIGSAAVSTGKTVIDLLTGLLLVLFVTIFLLYDGDGVWQFLLRAVPRPGRLRVDAAGRAAWGTLGHYVRGTLVVAAFHGVVIAITLWILGVPLVAPLALIVALGSFVPLIGAIVAGALAAGVAALEQGIVAGIIVVVVLVVDTQVEGHVLQPFVVGRYVRVHPLAVVLTLAAGTILFGLFGAIVAVPVMACTNSGVRALLRVPEPELAMEPERVPPEPLGRSASADPAAPAGPANPSAAGPAPAGPAASAGPALGPAAADGPGASGDPGGGPGVAPGTNGLGHETHVPPDDER